MDILHLGKPTPNDNNFYTRWESLGRVFKVPFLKSQIEVVVTDQYTLIDDKFIAQYPNLRYVVSPTTGNTHLTFKSDIIKTLNLEGEYDFLSSITSTAEMTIHFILSLFKADNGEFKVSGKEIGIIGMGRVGKQVANICSAMGMIVRGFDKNSPDGPLYLRSIFRTVDIISIHLSENKTTRGMIDSDLILSMRKDAYFVNTSRASIIDENALLFAMKNKLLKGVALDVCNDGHVLKRETFLPFILTDHIAGRSFEDRIATDEFMVNKLSQALGYLWRLGF